MSDTELIASIRQRAYQIWESEGRPSGRHVNHWLLAEREIRGGSAQTKSSEAKASAPSANKRKSTSSSKRQSLSH